MTIADFVAGVRRNIAEKGRSVVCVFGGPSIGDDHPICYTIGNALRGHPELILVAPISPETVVPLLNALSEHAVAIGRPFNDGERVRLPGQVVDVQIIDADNSVRARFNIHVRDFIDVPSYRMQQVVVPDPAGRFPGEDGCEAPYRDWPIFHVKRTLN